MAYKNCKNCNKENTWGNFSKGYCRKCYGLIIKKEKVKNGEIPKTFDLLYRMFFDLNDKQKVECVDFLKEEIIKSIDRRLELIKDSNNIRDDIQEHDLEYKINGTLRKLGCKKTLGKMNDAIRFYLKGESRGYVYNIFCRAQLLKKFDYEQKYVYDMFFRFFNSKEYHKQNKK